MPGEISGNECLFTVVNLIQRPPPEFFEYFLFDLGGIRTMVRVEQVCANQVERFLLIVGVALEPELMPSGPDWARPAPNLVIGFLSYFPRKRDFRLLS